MTFDVVQLVILSFDQVSSQCRSLIIKTYLHRSQMVNPGAFKGARLEFLLAQKSLYAAAALKGHTGDTIVNIQRRFFKRFPIDLPDDEEPTDEWLKAVDDNVADPEPDAPDENALSVEDFTDAMKKFKKRAERLDFRRHVSLLFRCHAHD